MSNPRHLSFCPDLRNAKKGNFSVNLETLKLLRSNAYDLVIIHDKFRDQQLTFSPETLLRYLQGKNPSISSNGEYFVVSWRTLSNLENTYNGH